MKKHKYDNPVSPVSGMTKETQTVCGRKPQNTVCRGVLCRLPVSRLEESLGHAVYQCDKCGATYKFIPKDTEGEIVQLVRQTT